MTEFILAQVCGALSFIVMGLYMLLNVKRTIICIGNVICSLLFTLEYLFLHAYTGCICALISAVMSFVYIFKDKSKIIQSWAMPVIFSILFIIFGVLTWDNLYSLLPILCNVASTLMFFESREVILKIYNVPISILWIIYNIVYKGYAGLAGQSVILLLNIIFLMRYIINKKKKNKNETSIKSDL